MGKHKVDYTPYADCGDYVIVINAEKIKLSIFIYGGIEHEEEPNRNRLYP